MPLLNKNFSVYRNYRQHPITESDHFVCLNDWSLKAAAGFNGTGTNRMYVLDNPISHIKATAEEEGHDTAVTQPYYAQRVTIRVGTMDPMTAGIRYDGTHAPGGWRDASHADYPDTCWYRIFYLDEAEELLGPFDYVELEANPDDESIVCYEIIN